MNKCESPYEEIKVESEKEETKKLMTGGSDREDIRKDSIRAASSMSRPSTTDLKMDWLVRTVKEMKEEVACKNEIKSILREIVRSELKEIKQELKNKMKSMFREIVKSELGVIKQEIELLKENVQGRFEETAGNVQKSYAGAVMEKKKV